MSINANEVPLLCGLRMCPQLKYIYFMADSEQSFGQQVLGSLKQGAADAIGGLPGTAINMGVSAFNNWLAERSAQKQYDRQIDFWEMQNEYNSPLNQRIRLQEAGLNPVAAAGDIGGHNTAGSLSTVPGNQYAQNGVFDPNVLGNNMLLLKQMESIGANTDLLERQVELSFIQEYIMNAEAYGLDLSNEEKKKLLGYIDKEKELSFAKVVAEIDNIKSSTANYNQAVEESKARVEKINNDIEVALRSADREDKRFALEQYVAHLQALKTQAETAKITSETEAQDYYNHFIAPLQRINQMLENSHLAKENSFTEARKEAVELENKLKTGDAQGFVTYLNYYIDKSLSAARIAVDAFL